MKTKPGTIAALPTLDALAAPPAVAQPEDPAGSPCIGEVAGGEATGETHPRFEDAGDGGSGGGTGTVIIPDRDGP